MGTNQTKSKYCIIQASEITIVGGAVRKKEYGRFFLCANDNDKFNKISGYVA